MVTILVVDDEPEMLSLVATALGRSGLEVLKASSALTALDVCSNADQALGLVVADFHLAEMTGLQMAEQMCRQRPALEFIFMSGSQQAYEELVADGHTCVRKPFSLDELRNAVQRRLETLD